mgnify:CR=1 FL=1
MLYGGLKKNCQHCVRKKKRLCFLGEPPYVKRYTKAFREQFGYVFGCQPKMIRRGEMQKLMPTLAWMAGCKIGTNVSMDDLVHICPIRILNTTNQKNNG